MNNRRDFIKKSLLVGGGVYLASSPFSSLYAQSASPKGKTAIILGAGFAGLAAANRLIEKGWKVTVLESKSRIGGRVFSHHLNQKHVIELGAEWVGASHSRVIELCESFGLTLNDNRFQSHLIYKGKYSKAGEWDYSANWNAKFDKILSDFKQLPEIEKRKLDKYDWWRYLLNNGCGGRDLDIRELLDSTDFGESIRHVSAFSALAEYSESSKHNEMDYKIQGGNSQLAIKLADKIGHENIHVKHKAIKVTQDKKVKVECDNGLTFEADKLICTLPTLAIKHIEWLPGLPTEKIDAINALQYARINKHAVTFENRFWGDEAFDMVTDENPHYFYHATKNQEGPEGILISYTIGDKAAVWGNKSDLDCLLDFEKTLHPHFPNFSKILNHTNYYWGNDESSLGAYALYGINQWFTTRPTLAKPFKHTHFAGEHLADWQGFMEGAINTGEEAANQII